MKKTVFLLILSMIVISSISVVAAVSVDTSTVAVMDDSDNIQIGDYSVTNRRGIPYDPLLAEITYKHKANCQTFDIDNDGNANFLIDDDQNFLICDYDNDGDADFAVEDYDNDGDLDIIYIPNSK